MAIDTTHGYIYWTNSIPGGGSAIGRANLDGTGVNTDLITTRLPAAGVAVDSADGHIYWTMPGLPTNTSGGIGRANLDGTGANQTFMLGLHYPQGVAVDSAGGHIYWTTNNLGGTIGRANLDGSGVNEDFILGASNAQGVALDTTNGYIYWTNLIPHGASTIGRANLDGSGVNTSFISTLLPAAGVAVDDLSLLGGPPPTPTVARLVAVVQSFGLPRGIEGGLIAKLDAAQRSLDSDHIEVACGELGAFINAVKAQSNKTIGAANATSLVAQATTIRQALGCHAH